MLADIAAALAAHAAAQRYAFLAFEYDRTADELERLVEQRRLGALEDEDGRPMGDHDFVRTCEGIIFRIRMTVGWRNGATGLLGSVGENSD